jgi:hypothetical protein
MSVFQQPSWFVLGAAARRGAGSGPPDGSLSPPRRRRPVGLTIGSCVPAACRVVLLRRRAW